MHFSQDMVSVHFNTFCTAKYLYLIPSMSVTYSSPTSYRMEILDTHGSDTADCPSRGITQAYFIRVGFDPVTLTLVAAQLRIM